jgi:hypothetical protein
MNLFKILIVLFTSRKQSPYPPACRTYLAGQSAGAKDKAGNGIVFPLFRGTIPFCCFFSPPHFVFACLHPVLSCVPPVFGGIQIGRGRGSCPRHGGGVFVFFLIRGTNTTRLRIVRMVCPIPGIPNTQYPIPNTEYRITHSPIPDPLFSNLSSLFSPFRGILPAALQLEPTFQGIVLITTEACPMETRSGFFVARRGASAKKPRCRMAMGQGDGVIEAISFNKSKKSNRSNKADRSFFDL